MIQEFMFYSFLLGAALFFGTWLLAKKDKGIAWVVTAIVCFLVVAFVFPSPQQAPDLAGMANNITLLLSKVLYVVSWGAAAALLHKFLP
ncbi:hypothetical protein [Pseudomonas chlororaphis]|uniref:hypothetical protein n=1 Tax=Pseudomonas chlororaphis TaxID=587753 RepID=UPI000F578AD9|nr:hypothetical protein [Pseudomonas chlororaphis]AZC67379.1 hypothetical protein C4K32_0690 [Pseudomonas chlororaphis subsp. piscium]MBP5056353.1 hypothetical protein [Pseudomonas chlororaphis]MBP5140121.1 hypothetical protein [Pseudomonas chlororaphis]QTT98490.1 hypothetical protein HUT26_04110 [Pseudomonas chlororaphis]